MKITISEKNSSKGEFILQRVENAHALITGGLIPEATAAVTNLP